MDYPVTITRDDNDTWLATFPDIEGVTFGNTVEEALAHASDALASLLEAYIRDRRPIPRPSSKPSKYRVRVPALVAAKVRLYETMQAQKVGKAELARRLRCHLPQVDRLLTMKHGSKIDQLEAAFKAIGKDVEFMVHDAEPVFAGKVRHGVKPPPKRRAATRRG